MSAFNYTIALENTALPGSSHYEAGFPDIRVRLITAILFAYVVTLSLSNRGRSSIKAPYIGVNGRFEPRAVSSYRFFRRAQDILGAGYQQYKSSMFKLAQNGSDLIILPGKYLDELKSVSETHLSPRMAHAKNFIYRYSRTEVLLESNLHFRVLQKKLGPNLVNVFATLQDELATAIKEEIPPSEDEWISLNTYDFALRLVARISARVFVGFPVCRREDWLKLSTDYTINVLTVITVLRFFPPWMHPLIAFFLPARWRIESNVRAVKKHLIPEFNRRRQMPAAERPQDLLTWMIECANEEEADPETLARLELTLTLAAIHTTSSALAHAINDLCARREYIEPLREEMSDVLAGHGKWEKASYSRLRKLDSFMKESQRFNPPSLLAFQRIAVEPFTFSDGKHIPKGAHIGMPVHAIQNDPAVTPNPEEFDGLRYYKYRQNPAESHQHQFTTTDRGSLNFGFGKYACPGRFFAGMEIKSILVKLLMEYDIKFPEGQGRPSNMRAFEYIFINREGRMLLRQRKVPTGAR